MISLTNLINPQIDTSLPNSYFQHLRRAVALLNEAIDQGKITNNDAHYLSNYFKTQCFNAFDVLQLTRTTAKLLVIDMFPYTQLYPESTVPNIYRSPEALSEELDPHLYTTHLPCDLDKLSLIVHDIVEKPRKKPALRC